VTYILEYFNPKLQTQIEKWPTSVLASFLLLFEGAARDFFAWIYKENTKHAVEGNSNRKKANARGT